jgi:hypothetical protein
MRSDLVFGATKQISNRFLLANTLATAARGLHKRGTRIQDTTNDVLIRFGWANDPLIPRIAKNPPGTATRKEPRQ